MPKRNPKAAIASIALAITTTLALLPSRAGAIWTEAGDAGETVGGAQVTAGAGALTQIVGALPNAIDVDLYLIRIVDEANFKAWMNGLMMADKDLWLFTASGMGVAYDDSVNGGQTKVDSAFVTTNGLYLLGVSSQGSQAMSAGGAIWLPSLFVAQRAPDGPGAGQPLTYFGGTPVNNGASYTVYLQGAEFATVPEPSTAMLVGAGLLLLGRSASRRSRERRGH